MFSDAVATAPLRPRIDHQPSIAEILGRGWIVRMPPDRKYPITLGHDARQIIQAKDVGAAGTSFDLGRPAMPVTKRAK